MERKATGSYRAYSIPSKTATLVPEFVVEDLLSALAMTDLPLGRTLMMMMMIMSNLNN